MMSIVRQTAFVGNPGVRPLASPAARFFYADLYPAVTHRDELLAASQYVRRDMRGCLLFFGGRREMGACALSL